MSKFAPHFLLLAVTLLPIKLSAYAGLEKSALWGEVEAVSSLVKSLNPQEQPDIKQVEQALEKVNSKIAAIYAGKERTLDNIKLATNGAKSLWGIAGVLTSMVGLSTLTDGFSELSGLAKSWTRVFPHEISARSAAKATVVALASVGIISAIYTVKSVGAILDGIENFPRETTALLERLLTVREILKNFLKS